MKPSLRIPMQKRTASRLLKPLILLAVLLVAYQTGRAISLRNEIATLQQQAQMIDGSAITQAHNDVAEPGDANQSATLQRIRAELLMPWEPVLDAIADNAGDAVALRAVRPDSAARQAEVSGVARTRDDFLDYVKRLRRDKRLHHAEPLGDEPNRMPTTMNNDGVLFHLRITWGAAP